MPTVSEVVGGWLTNATKHPKSTANGIITALGIVLPYFVIKHWIAVDVAGALATMLASARVAIGGAQQDSGRTEAIPAGSSTPQMVDSHETPNQPATPVVPNP